MLLEEPFGTFGGLNPTGHAAVYLTRVCADSPTHLRVCTPGEAGVVISRYRKVGGYDWLAVPFLPYLYAVDNLQEVPLSADAQSVAALRDAYRRAHLLTIAPNNAAGRAPEGEWTQLVGAAYDRKIYELRIATRLEQDEAFIRLFNDRKNQAHFNMLFRNCADFARNVLNFYHPHSVHRNFFADAGITTPKQVAKSLTRYCQRHPELQCSFLTIPQVEGSLHRSEPVNGVLESLLKTKKYVVPMAILHPVVTGSMMVAYLAQGRFNPQRKSATVFDAHAVPPPAVANVAFLPAYPLAAKDGWINPGAAPPGNCPVGLSLPNESHRGE